jgi:hypothetical protein
MGWEPWARLSHRLSEGSVLSNWCAGFFIVFPATRVRWAGLIMSPFRYKGFDNVQGVYRFMFSELFSGHELLYLALLSFKWALLESIPQDRIFFLAKTSIMTLYSGTKPYIYSARHWQAVCVCAWLDVNGYLCH